LYLYRFAANKVVKKTTDVSEESEIFRMLWWKKDTDWFVHSVTWKVGRCRSR